MVAYSFHPRFVDAIRCGRKRQTIRPHRKRHARPGEEMQLYTGMRTRNCRLIARVTCASVHEIEINFAAQRIVVDGIPVDDLAAFARADGFEGDDPRIIPHAAMRAFFDATYGGETRLWYGVLLRWLAHDAVQNGAEGGLGDEGEGDDRPEDTQKLDHGETSPMAAGARDHGPAGLRLSERG